MKALLEISFKPYAMTDDKSQGRLDQKKIVKDDFWSRFQHDCDRLNFVGSDSHDGPHLEAEIDNLVYALYGLTPEEIAIVEGKNK